MRISPIVNVNPNYSYTNNYKRQNYTATNSKISFGDGTFDYDKRLQEKLDARSGWKKFFGLGKKKAKNEANIELIGFSIAHREYQKKMEESAEYMKALVAQKEETIKIMEKNNQILEERLKDAQKAQEKDETILELKRQLEEAKNATAREKADLAAEKQKLNKLKQEQEILTKRESGKGWDKIAGYDNLKNQMEETFINKLALEKAGYEVSMPNGILLYGQHGTGKTRFAEAFSQQADCNFVEIDTMQDNDDILQDVRSSLKEAKKHYKSNETPQKRTVILLDDFNAIAQLSEKEKQELENNNYDFEDTSVGQLAEYLSDCASKYKSTIFMTTNHPRKIDSELLNKDLIPYQIFLGPPKPNDAAKILKYHVQDFTNQEIDYDKLGAEIAKAVENEEAYSAQGIVNIVEYAKEKAKGAQITEADLMQAIKEVPPDITKKTFNDFLDEMSDTLEEYARKNLGEE